MKLLKMKMSSEFKFVNDTARCGPNKTEKEVKVELNLFRDYYNSWIVHYFVHLMYKQRCISVREICWWIWFSFFRLNLVCSNGKRAPSATTWKLFERIQIHFSCDANGIDWANWTGCEWMRVKYPNNSHPYVNKPMHSQHLSFVRKDIAAE